MKFIKYYLLLSLVFLMNFSAFSQTRKQLENQRKKYKSEIVKLNRLLFNEVKKEKNALEALKDINRKIDVRNKLINTINLEAKLLTNEINGNERKITKLNKELKALKADYAEMIYKSYKSKSQQSRLMFLLSSQNFYQAYKRLEYTKQYTQFRKKQGEQIQVQANFIKKLNDSLFYQKKVKDTLILVEKNQKNEIESDKKNQESLISQIKKKEGKYKREIQRNAKEERKVAARIDKIIKEEIAKANRLALSKSKSKTNKTVVKKSSSFILTPEAKALAAKFELNKGKLPWPVKEGIVVRKFGKQPHPTFPGIIINGTGLHIVTSNGSNAKAIFKGEVLNILVGSGGTKNVLIRHGNYITSYNNLENAYVKKGDKIEVGQDIGRIFTDKVSKKTKLVFVLFKNTTRLNPASWILKR
ncbi:peptidoglycan DD-metalloendopeptidase family protein [Polaribacter vadi]|uniref:murein hydrolase activator EnvC family protein n=1 Tax=Polaribacter TaxID=52959 RepID=UPI001C08501A|nr:MULTISPECIES: peptidoglycan DD-metalloendopeptidase family protein [Polaribacter]MBU3010909.1 peptidoglycan DD-metalloendopeptidase family protein [Polaribacter vadi]MDO6740721.1 peptidoglycan DD-metalloendopeptidase family protein [Polaribacter sp. 1_MG-2023]